MALPHNEPRDTVGRVPSRCDASVDGRPMPRVVRVAGGRETEVIFPAE